MSWADNPQAYPCLDSSEGGLSMHDPGMTLRDYFAGQALVGLLAAGVDDGGLSECAYTLADFMLAARKQGGAK